jgi:glycosyltransferase involved in cell wall biosynthesis
VGDGLTGVGVYSREILFGLAASGFADGWDWFYRSPRFWRALWQTTPRNAQVRRLSDRGGNRAAPIFHGLNQRLPKLRFRRQVATFHDLFVLSGNYSTREFRDRFASQARDAAASADLIIAVSAFTASQVEHFLKVPAAQIRVIHHGVTARAIPQVPREKVILCVGAIQRRKNQIALIRALRAAPPDWKLVLAGSRGYDADLAFQEAANSPLADRIQITGYVSDEQLGDWYARASVFAFPSLDEGFGMPALEAMAAGLPVIASNRSAVAEVCGDAALLVDPENGDELAGAIGLLATDEERRRTLAATGLEHAAKFRWADAVDKTIRAYKELL